MSAAAVKRTLRALGDPNVAAHARRFFKTGRGEYGEGDRFLGVRVPELRAQARVHRSMALGEVVKLLKSRYHEERLCALLILVCRYESADAAEQVRICDVYLAHSRYVNNWDLVDSSAHLIVGTHLRARSRRPLYSLARSASLWERRIAILATLAFIRDGEFDDTLALAEQLLDDEEDLIHKAVGWMLREIGNRNRAVEERFLRAHCNRMPRTMLRYAIEKFPEKKRLAYLRGRV